MFENDKMNILVAGGAWFIGSAVVRQVINKSQDSVVNVDLLTYVGNLESLSSVSDSNLYDGEDIPWGTYNYCGRTNAWKAFAESIFDLAVSFGMVDKAPRIEPIINDEYPTPAQRPFTSVLDCQKIAQKYAITQPDWNTGLNKVLIGSKTS